MTWSWADDEIGPLGPLVELHNNFVGPALGNPQYPLFHYILVAAFYAPYLLLQWLMGALVDPQPGYPYGFTEPVTSVQTLLLIARSVSVLMGVGTVVVAYFTAKTLWNRTVGLLAGIFVALMYPMFYYARMSNVDVPALFWTSLVLLLFARVLKDGLPTQRAIWMGLFAALAGATKDASYGILILLPLAFLPVHFGFLRQGERTDVWSQWKAPLTGLVVSAAVYAIASGMVLRLEKYFRHLEVLAAGGSFRYYFEYPPTLAGYGGLAWETFGHLVDALGWPILVGSGMGVLVCWRRERLKLALLLTFLGLFVTVLAPMRFVLLRFVIIVGFVLACFAARAVASGLRSGRRSARAAAGLLLVTGCGLGLLRGADLTYIMLNHSRYQVSEWLVRHTHDGDRVEHSGWEHRFRRLPLLQQGLIWMSSALIPLPGDQKLQGEFVLLAGRDDLENHSVCPRWVFEGLMNGSMGYELVADIQTPSLFDLHYEHLWVNARFLIFARRDRARQLMRESERQF